MLMSGTNRSTPGASQLSGVLSSTSSGAIAILILVCVLATSQSSSFLSLDNGFNIASQMVFVLLLALGTTIVLITGGIDLSVGSVMGLTAGVVAYLVSQGLPLGVAMLAAVAVGALLGLVNGLIITKLGLPDFIATLAMLGVARGLLFLWTEGTPFIGYMSKPYYVIGGLERPFGYLTIPIMVAMVATFAVFAVLKYTAFGRHCYGVGSSSDAARLSGVRVPRIRVLAYVVSGLLAGVAGVLLAGQTTAVAPDLGSGYELQAIAAAIIGGAALSGGRGHALGAVMGTLILAATANAMNISGVSAVWQPVVVGFVLLLSVILDRLTEKQRGRSAHLPSAPAVATAH
jgi:ribose transport system permease protein